jgi:hypothetical protein
MKTSPHSPAAAIAFASLIILCAALFAPTAPLRAQIQSTPLTTWRVTIVLPPKLMAGHPATLAVLGVDGKLASGVAVDLGGGESVTTDRTGRALFNVPASGDYLIAKASGTSVAALVDPAVGASEPEAIRLPAIASVRDGFWIGAAGLRGDADANTVRVNGQLALVLAVSPECLVALPGLNTAPGPVSVTVEAPGVQWSATTTLVSLGFESPNPPLQPGQKGQLAVHVRGSNQKLGIVVQNESPGVLRFLKHDVQEVVTSGGPDNTATIKVQAITSGDFSFRARLVSAPDVAAAERYLLAAEVLAPKDLQRPLLEFARRLMRHPRDVPVVRAQLQQIATSTMAGDFRTLLDAAESAL